MLNHFLLQQRARWGRCEKALGAAVMALAIALVSGCAPQQTTLDNAGTAESATVGTAATAFEWSPEADCATCHVKQASSTADAQCLASTHEDSACNSCHSDSEGLQNVHEGVASAEVELTRLKKNRHRLQLLSHLPRQLRSACRKDSRLSSLHRQEWPRSESPWPADECGARGYRLRLLSYHARQSRCRRSS